MGLIVKGVEYETVSCSLCSNFYKVNEENKNGISKRDAVSMSRVNSKIKESDHICYNCCIDLLAKCFDEFEERGGDDS